MPALSIITVQEILDEKSVGEKWSELTAAEKYQLINSSAQETCDDDFINGKDDYRINNYTSPIEGVNPSDLRIGSGLASIAGTPIVFMVAAVPKPLGTATPKIMLPPGVSYIDPVGDVDSRTANGFSAFAASDDTPFDYIAGDPT